ncbi:Cytochrome P450 monooxygenase fsdH [Lachnellula suecica]|uniref:Cytochrome P450 monooxygenase fsdH n=1 Tax=Lachnellula suecica TaxID=602035 RepID=A0A8T9C880_9HELO|nr:Cytochrome P450 monooxygenase fsdH [Lachnellula suecica]
MLSSLIVRLVWTAAALLVSVLLSRKWISHRAFRAAVDKHGCQRPRKHVPNDLIVNDLAKARAQAAKDGHAMKPFMDDFERYGKTWEEKDAYGTTIINTMDKLNIQQVLSLGHQDYSKPDRSMFAPFFGKGIFMEEGAAWKHSRDMIKPIFSRAELSDMDAFQRHVDRFIKIVPRDGTPVDLQPLLKKLFLDSSTEFIFGESMDSQLPGDPNNSAALLRAFDEAFVGAGKRRAAGKLARVKLAFDKSWKVCLQQVHAFVDRHVERALSISIQEDEESAQASGQKRHILLHEMAKHIRDPVDLRFRVLNIFIPALDSIAILVGNVLFHLARNPEAWSQLRKESARIEGKPLTYELLRSLKLFRDVVNETIRLQGIVGRAERLAICNTLLPVGGGTDGKAPVFVEKGTIVGMVIWGLHHDKEIWGEDFAKFNPQRWVDKPSTGVFLPFFAGPRICPAQQQVMTQAIYLLVRMSQEFVLIENQDPVTEYVENLKVLAESRNGVQVSLISSESTKEIM